MWRSVLESDAVASGGVTVVRVEGDDIAICRVGDEWYAVARRCGHRNAALERGTLYGHYLTCPLHFVRFDVRTGAALNPPVGKDGLMEDVPTHDLRTYPVRQRGHAVEVDV